MVKSPRIIFLGTPDFAVPALEALVLDSFDVAAVVTAPDQPAGRGLQFQSSPVKKFALEHHIPVLQPEKLKNEEFLSQLAACKADLFIVVAFRMLPEAVWKMPLLGTFNLHASLLPQYRGAAPIHHAIMNGETETGLTTFFLRQEIDTGEIIFQEKMAIGPEETTGELHDRMKIAGAGLVLKTVKAIAEGKLLVRDQNSMADPSVPLKPAPKIFREDCQIDWSHSARDIYNKVRGLNPLPTAATRLIAPDGDSHPLKVFKTSIINREADNQPGSLLTDGKSYIFVKTGDGALALEEIQLAGKRRMSMEEFLRGFHLDSDWKVG
jgi:methionyl-tRNA formyltransferase